MRTPIQTAILLSVLFKRSELSRVRISQKTLKLLSYRFRLKSAFVVSVSDAIADFGLYLIELDTGGYALVSAKSLEGAKAVTAKRLMGDMLKRLVDGSELDFESLEEEALAEAEDPVEED